jgi:hypothetical protein
VQLSGVTHEKFNPFRRTCLLTWALLIANIVFSVYFKKSVIDEPKMYLFLSIVSFLSLIHFIANVLYELKNILGINILTLTDKQLAALKTMKVGKKDH